MTAETDFTTAVAAFTHGTRFDRYLSVVRKGLIARGNNATDVEDYIMKHAPRPAPDRTKVRNAIRYALDHDRRPTAPTGKRTDLAPRLTEAERRARRLALLPQAARDFVPVTLREYARTRGYNAPYTADIFGIEVRGEIATSDLACRTDAAARQLRAMFHGCRIWAGTIAADANGIVRKTPFIGDGIIDADDLAERIEHTHGCTIPTHVSLNPLTGRPGTTSRGTRSFDCIDTIDTFRHVLIEWDALADANGMPSQEQIEIVAGVVDYASDTGRICPVCATYTGGKSIHVALRVPDGDRAAYTNQLAALADLFASARDARYRIDTTGWANGSAAATHMRLAGAVRPETGRRQRLLWCAD